MPTAFAALSLTHGSITNGVDSQHDVIPYSLSFTVNSSAPTGALPEYVAADLEPTSISVDSATVNKVLISMAIPADTVLDATPTAPAGWTVVYTTTATSTNAQVVVSWTAPSGTISSYNLYRSTSAGTE
jgi:hypothetical protein